MGNKKLVHNGRKGLYPSQYRKKRRPWIFKKKFISTMEPNISSDSISNEDNNFSLNANWPVSEQAVVPNNVSSNNTALRFPPVECRRIVDIIYFLEQLSNASINYDAPSMNMPHMNETAFNHYHNIVADGWKKSALKEMNEAAKEEARLACESGDINKGGVPIITDIADGCWVKQSYQFNHSSLSGAASMSTSNGEVKNHGGVNGENEIAKGTEIDISNFLSVEVIKKEDRLLRDSGVAVETTKRITTCVDSKTEEKNKERGILEGLLTENGKTITSENKTSTLQQSENNDCTIVTEKSDIDTVVIEDDSEDEAEAENDGQDALDEPLVNYSDLVKEPCCDHKNKSKHQCQCQCHNRCGVCQKLFGNKKHLKIHSILHYGEDKALAYIRRNSKVKEPKKPKEPKEPAKPARQNLPRCLRNTEASHKCEICSASFSRLSSFLCHKKMHAMDKQYLCGVCEATFKYQSELHAHLATHGLRLSKLPNKQEPIYRCSECSKPCLSLTKYVEHKSMHDAKQLGNGDPPVDKSPDYDRNVSAADICLSDYLLSSATFTEFITHPQTVTASANNTFNSSSNDYNGKCLQSSTSFADYNVTTSANTIFTSSSNDSDGKCLQPGTSFADNNMPLQDVTTSIENVSYLSSVDPIIKSENLDTVESHAVFLVDDMPQCKIETKVFEAVEIKNENILS